MRNMRNLKDNNSYNKHSSELFQSIFHQDRKFNFDISRICGMFSLGSCELRNKSGEMLLSWGEKNRQARLKTQNSSKVTSTHFSRCNLKKFSKILNLPKDMQELLGAALLSKAQNPKNPFLSEADAENLAPYILNKLDILSDSFFWLKDSHFVVVHIREDRSWYILSREDLCKAIIKDVNLIGCRLNSSGMDIGRFLLLQRKGGAKESVGDSQDLSHGSNDLQIKWRCSRDFLEYAGAIKCQSAFDFTAAQYLENDACFSFAQARESVEEDAQSKNTLKK